MTYMKLGKPAPDTEGLLQGVAATADFADSLKMGKADAAELVNRFCSVWNSGIHLGTCMLNAFCWGFLHAVMKKERRSDNYTGDPDVDAGFDEYDGDVAADFEGENGEDAENAAQDAANRWGAAAYLLGWDQGHDYMLSKEAK